MSRVTGLIGLTGLTGLALVFASAPAALAFVLEVPADHARIANALAASVAGDTVRVAAGTWSPSVNSESFPLIVPDSVVLSGAGMGASILDAEGTAGVIELNGSGTARVEGFTLTGGVALRGGGVQIAAGTHELSDLLVLGCGALQRGAGINVEGSAAPDIHHSVIWECYDTDLVDSGDPHGAQWGGTATGSFRHNLVGRGDSNGLFTFESAGPEIRHSIFLDNGIDGLRGRGICHAGTAGTVIAHNLFWANSIASLIMRDANNSFVNVNAATANDISLTDGVYGNLDGDPLLVDPDLPDFHLQPLSPAIDAGEPGTGTDPDGTVLDIGPFAFDSSATASPRAPSRALRLGPPRPNPFNPRTVLELTLEREGPVLLTIHDARGRRVRTLLSTRLDAGNWPVVFDGTDDEGRALASGVYFARVRGEAEHDSQPMVLVR